MTSTWTRETLTVDAVEELKDEIKGKNVVITGVTVGGLGFEAAYAISKYAALVVLIGSNAQRLQASEDKILEGHQDARIRKVVADLSSLDAVRRAAAEINAFDIPIHVVIASAASIPRKEYSVSADGFETQFAVDHLAHFLLIKSIFPRVLAARSEAFSPRIVVISSLANTFGPVRLDDLSFGDGKEYNFVQAYAQAKSANILFVKELAKRFGPQGILTFAVHPGSILTQGVQSFGPDERAIMGISNPDGSINEKHFETKTLKNAPTTYVVAAFDPRTKGQSGSYISEDAQIHNEEVAPHASDPENARKLWELSEKLVGEEFKA